LIINENDPDMIKGPILGGSTSRGKISGSGDDIRIFENVLENL
jgi:hypothetical protein